MYSCLVGTKIFHFLFNNTDNICNLMWFWPNGFHCHLNQAWWVWRKSKLKNQGSSCYYAEKLCGFWFMSQTHYPDIWCKETLNRLTMIKASGKSGCVSSWNHTSRDPAWMHPSTYHRLINDRGIWPKALRKKRFNGDHSSCSQSYGDYHHLVV